MNLRIFKDEAKFKEDFDGLAFKTSGILDNLPGNWKFHSYEVETFFASFHDCDVTEHELHYTDVNTEGRCIVFRWDSIDHPWGQMYMEVSVDQDNKRMAKPEHTAYQLMADFGDNTVEAWTGKGVEAHTGPVAIAESCIKAGNARSTYFATRLAFAMPADGHITFGLSKAETLLKIARVAAKDDFSKGVRPSFFLRKLTMSEFIAHKNFKNYKGDPLIKTLYKKYLLMDLLSEKGYQMS